MHALIADICKTDGKVVSTILPPGRPVGHILQEDNIQEFNVEEFQNSQLNVLTAGCLWATQVLAADLKTVKSQIFNFRIRDLRIRGSEGPILTRPSILLGKVEQKCLCGYPAPVCCFPFCTLF